MFTDESMNAFGEMQLAEFALEINLNWGGFFAVSDGGNNFLSI